MSKKTTLDKAAVRKQKSLNTGFKSHTLPRAREGVGELASGRLIAAEHVSEASSEGNQTSDLEFLEIGTLVMAISLIRSLVCFQRSLVYLLRTARFARVLRCAATTPLLARSLIL